MISSSPSFSNEQKKFIVKLPYSTGSAYNATVKSCIGLPGILKRIEEFQNNPRVYGYFPYIIIQPFVTDNTEAKIVCFDGKAISRNPNKRGSSGRSLLGKGGTSTPMLFEFAEEVITKLRVRCPSLISDQVLRVDMFQKSDTGLLIVNEVEGFEAQNVAGYGGDTQFIVSNMTQNYWESAVTNLIDYHIKSMNNFESK
jgi:hypothetical protein